MTKDAALKLALSTLNEVRSETFRLMRNGQKLYAEEKVWSTIIAIKEALAQPLPDLTEQQRESYQKGHNDGVAHHKQAVKAAQPEQEENTKQRVLQLIKELRPAIRPMEALGKPMTTQEWFDVLVKNIEVMI